MAALAVKDEQAVKDVENKIIAATNADEVMKYYDQNDIDLYDFVPPLQYKGADAYRKDYTDLFAQFDGPLHVEYPDMHIEAGASTAFAYGLERLTGKLNDGTPVDLWLRYTEGLKHINGQWLIVHEHISVPVDMATGKARMDLKP